MSSTKSFFSPRIQWGCFALALILIIAAYALYVSNMIRWQKSPDFGWRPSYDMGPNAVTQVFPVGEAAGLQVGDTIQAINGQTYSTFEELYKIRNSAPGSVNTYQVLRSGKTFEITITTRPLGFKSVLYRSGSFFLLGLAYVVIGTLVFLMKPIVAESWIFFVMSSFTGLMFSYYGPSDLISPRWLYDVRLVFILMFPATMIHVALMYPKKRTFQRKIPWFPVVPYLMSLILFVLVEILAPTTWTIPPFLNRITKLYTLLGILGFVVSNIWNFWDKSILVRLQSKVITLGMIFALFIPTTDILMRSIWHEYRFPAGDFFLMVFIIFFPLSIGYTIVKYDLFAIDAVIKRTYGYIITTGSIAGIYGLVVLISNIAFRRFEITKSPLFPILFILAVVFLFNPIRNRVQKFIDRVFYRLEYDYQETVQRISESLRSLLSFDQIGQRMMETASHTMFMDSGCLFLFKPEEKAYLSLACTEKRDELGKPIPSPLATAKLSADDPLVQKMGERKKEVTIYDIQKDPVFEKEREVCQQSFDQLEAALIVPIVYEDHLTGLISLGNKKSGKFYRREDINLLRILANQGAVAIENARLFEENIEKSRMEEELKIAHNLQTSMLPDKAPTLEGFSIVARSIAAREVGGDFYDFIEIMKDGAKRLGIVVGDVSGKAVSGALVMAASRSVFRVLTETHESVEEVMNRGNARLHRDVKKGMFVALLYAVLDPKEKTLTLSNAGQIQPILCSLARTKPEYIDSEGDKFPLGIVKDCHYQETRVSLKQGDILVFITDGIVEAVNDKGELYGFERFLNSIEEGRGLSPDELLEKIIKDVTLYVGKVEQHDDLTAVVVRVG